MNGLSCSAHQFLRQRPHAGVIPVSLVNLQRSELGIVRGIGAFIAEVPAELEHPVEAPYAQTFQIQLRRDPQGEVDVVGVDVRGERTRIGTSVHALENRSLDLDEPVFRQLLANGADRRAAGEQSPPRLVVERQVHLAQAYPSLRIAQPQMLVGRWGEAFRRHRP